MFLPKMMEYVKGTREKVAEELRSFFAEKQPLLAAINPLGTDVGQRLLDFSLQGKMIRGCLVPLGWALGHERSNGTPPPRPVFAAGAAMELFQAGLVVHDDIMDRDLVRRGRATIFQQYAEEATRAGNADPRHTGEALGICAGDVACFLAFELLARLDAPPAVRAALLEACAREMTVVGVAQMQDVAWGSSSAAPDEADILRMYRFKTSRYSFSLPLAVGAILAGAPAPLVAKLEEIGETIGILFQIRDDELGLFGDQGELGKPVGSDVREGKKTLGYVRLMALAGSPDRERLAGIFGNPSAGAADVEQVRRLAHELGVPQSVEETCRELRARACADIAALPTSAEEHRGILREMLDFALARRQ